MAANRNTEMIVFMFPASAVCIFLAAVISCSIYQVGHEYRQFTVMMCCTADGWKMPQYIVFCWKAMPIKEEFPDKVFIHMDERVYVQACGQRMALGAVDYARSKGGHPGSRSWRIHYTLLYEIKAKIVLSLSKSHH